MENANFLKGSHIVYVRLFVIITDAAAPFAYDDTLEIARVKKSSDRLLVNFHRSASS